MTIRTHVYCNAPRCDNKEILADRLGRDGLPTGWLYLSTKPNHDLFHFCSSACVAKWALEADAVRQAKNSELNRPLDNLVTKQWEPRNPHNPKETS